MSMKTPNLLVPAPAMAALEAENRALRVEMSHIRDNAVSFEQQLKEAKLTLRDQFAMAALTAIAATRTQPETMAEVAYLIADAMLEARAK